MKKIPALLIITFFLLFLISDNSFAQDNSVSAGIHYKVSQNSSVTDHGLALEVNKAFKNKFRIRLSADYFIPEHYEVSQPFITSSYDRKRFGFSILGDYHVFKSNLINIYGTTGVKYSNIFREGERVVYNDVGDIGPNYFDLRQKEEDFNIHVAVGIESKKLLGLFFEPGYSIKADQPLFISTGFRISL